MAIADTLAKRQRSISVAEFFEKNRHLLGFDSKTKAILTCVKEAVDNSMDACEDMAVEIKKSIDSAKKRGIDTSKLDESLKSVLPDIQVRILKASDTWRIVENPGKDNESIVGEIFLDNGKIVDSVGVTLVGKSAEKILNSERKAIQYEFKTEDEHRIFLKREPSRELPHYSVFLSSVKKGEKTVTKNFSFRTQINRFKVIIQDNGPGIVREQLPKIFGSLLYGSKFHTQKQARGQQGIGISAAILYGQLTTGKPAIITSRTSEQEQANKMTLLIDTVNNKPEIVSEEIDEKFSEDHGTRVEIEMEGIYTKAVAVFLKRTSIVNPHAKITLITPEGNKYSFKRTSNEFPKDSIEIKPHPHGIETGVFIRMLKGTSAKTMLKFLTNDFSRVGNNSGTEILKKADINPSKKPSETTREDASKIVKQMHKAKLMSPPTDCLSPIGEAPLRYSLIEELKPEYVVTKTRNPEVYRGIPFQIEAGIAYGGNLSKSEGSAKILRFANKIPLMWDLSACAITNAIKTMDWRRYGMNQPGGKGMPSGPVAIVIHLFSAWVPYTSEGKTAVASYPVIVKEIKLSLQDCARELKRFLTKKYSHEKKRRRVLLFRKYSSMVSQALSGLTDTKEDDIQKEMDDILKKRYGEFNEP